MAKKMRTKKKILVIDDEVKLIKLIKALLEKLNIEIELATDGSEGLKMLEDGKYDLIICDINMPKFNGIEVIQAAREYGIRDDFVFFTGHGSEDLMLESLKYGARGFINKPHFGDLKATVCEILEIHI